MIEIKEKHNLILLLLLTVIVSTSVLVLFLVATQEAAMVVNEARLECQPGEPFSFEQVPPNQIIIRCNP